MSKIFEAVRARFNISEMPKPKRNLFFSLLFSYIVILVIPLATSIFVLLNAHFNIDREIIKTNNAMLRQASQTVENIFVSISDFCIDLSVSENITSLLYAGQPLDVNQRYVISRAIKNDLSTNSSLRDVTGVFAVCFNRGEFVLTPTAYYEQALAYSSYFSAEFDTFEHWKDTVERYHFSKILSGNKSLIFIQSLPYIGSEPDANILLTIDKQQLAKRLNMVEWVKDGLLFIVDQNDNVLLCNNENGDYNLLVFKNTESEDGFLRGRYNGEDVYLSLEKSAKTGFSYILVMNNDYPTGNKEKLNMIFIYYIFAAAAAGVWLALFFAKKTYSPIKNMVRVLKNNQHTPDNGNEISFIDASIRKIMNLNADIRRQLEIESEQIRQNFVSRILRGRINLSFSEPGFLEENGISFPHDSFVAVLFKITGYSDYPKATEDGDGESPLDNMDFLLINTIQNTIREAFWGYICEADGMIAGIINFDSQQMQAVYKKLHDACQKVSDELSVKTAIAVSNRHVAFTGIQQAYIEACVAMECSLLEGEDRLFLYSESNSNSVYYYPSEIEQSLAGSLRSGNFKAAKEIINEIFKLNCEDIKLSSELFRCFIFDTAATFIRATENISALPDELSAGRIASSVSEIQSAVKLKEYFLATAKTISEIVNSGKESHNTVLLRAVTRYIGDNFADPGLCNASIADSVGITPAYLSRFFKQQTGSGILNYINVIRVDGAKKLIEKCGGKITLNEICAGTGFENATTFIRIFKKLEGITPGKYIELNFSDNQYTRKK